MEQANEVQNKVSNIGVAIQDSKLVGSIGRIGHEWARNQATSRQQFNSRELVDRIRAKYGVLSVDDEDGATDSVINWQTLGDDAALYFAWTPGATFLCTAASAGLRVKERRARQPAQARRDVEAVKPTDGSAAGAQQEKAQLMKRMNQCIQLLEEKGEVLHHLISRLRGAPSSVRAPSSAPASPPQPRARSSRRAPLHAGRHPTSTSSSTRRASARRCVRLRQGCEKRANNRATPGLPAARSLLPTLPSRRAPGRPAPRCAVGAPR